MLRRAEIKGFKCLHDVSVDLGPFNVLIGPNDSGKSSFLQALSDPSRWERSEAMHLQEALGIERSVYLRASDGEVRISFDADDLVALQLNGGHYLGGRLPNSDSRSKSFVRVSDPVMLEPREIAAPSAPGSGTLPKLINSYGRGSASHLARCALGDRERYEAIQKGMRDITAGRVREVIVGEDTGQGYPLSFRLYDDKIVKARDMSQGLLIYFAFLTIVHREDAPAVLLIEEPENGVHPFRLFDLADLLRTLTERGVQIIMTTHSPDLLNACRPEEVLVFRRPSSDSGTEVSRLPADFERRAMRDTMGQIWAAEGEEGLLDILPIIDPPIQTAAE